MYTVAESAKRALLLARGGAAMAAGRSIGPTDRALDALARGACEREAAEATAKEKERLAEVQRRADLKAKRRAKSIW